MLMANHSLADRNYELEGERLSEKEAEFFLNTWRAEIVITTFDQFLLALFSQKTRHLMRFHHLMDAVIILDEVQTFPPQSWDIVNQTLQALSAEGHSKVLMMSATQPQFLNPAFELTGSPQQIAEIFSQWSRYQIHFKHRTEQPLDEFTADLTNRVATWVKNQRVMITLNTRAAAKFVWKQLSAKFGHQVGVYLLTADVTPRDRLQKIEAIITDMQHDKPNIVVSTQTVEAGVDIDMDIVVRDFAPLDKIIQVAGRCNRNNLRGKHGGYVEVVHLRSQKGKKFSGYVYDKVLLNATHDVLKSHDVINEEDILTISNSYFQRLSQSMNTGKTLTQQYAYWQKMEPSVYSLLRAGGEQINFIVLDDNEGNKLRGEITTAFTIQDRWEKRRALQNLAGRINERSINIYAKRGFHPQDYAELLGYFWILRDGYYSEAAGLDLKLDDEDSVCIL